MDPEWLFPLTSELLYDDCLSAGLWMSWSHTSDGISKINKVVRTHNISRSDRVPEQTSQVISIHSHPISFLRFGQSSSNILDTILRDKTLNVSHHVILGKDLISLFFQD